MRRFSWLAVFCVISVGCSVTTSPRRPAYRQGSGAAGAATIAEPRDVLERLDHHLHGQGYAPLGPVIHNGNMPTHGVVAYAIDARPGTCFVNVVLGSAGTDLNLILIDPFGRTVGYDVGPDSHPWVAHCPAVGGRFTARVQMSHGSGQYYFASYGAPSGSTPQLARFWGTSEGTVQTAEIDSATSQRLSALDAELSGEGYRRVASPRGVVLEQGQDRNFPLNLNEGFCYTFASLGGPGVKDTDVFVVDGAGNELARDTQDGQDGSVHFCAQTTGSYTLRARLYQGQGPVFVAGYVKPSGEANAPAETPPPTQPVIEAQSVAGAGLEENFRLLDADMQARGYESYGDQARGELGPLETRDFEIQLQGGECYAILAVGDTGVRDMDLILLDPSGQPLDRDIEEDARPVVRVCPKASGDFTMRVGMVRGAGKFVYAPYRWPRGTHGPFGLNGIIYVRLAEVTSLLDNEGYAPSPDYTPGKGALKKQGDTATETFALKGGECYSVLVVGGEGVNDLDVALYDGSKAVAEDGTRNAFPSVRLCPKRDGHYRAKITAKNGAGEYFYQVFTREAP